MAIFKLNSSAFYSIGFIAILICLAYSFHIVDLLPKEKDSKVHILDQETQATILDVRHEKKSELLKGSILDYEGIYIKYEFHVGDQRFSKTELIKKSERNLSKIISSYDKLVNSNNKMLVRYNSIDPRHSALDYSKAIASF